MEFIKLINVKMSTLVDVVTSRSMILKTIYSAIARKVLLFLQRIRFNEQLKVRAN